ncbi:MAG TPA: spore coat protein CotJB [Bacillota bacterium]|nr:spore coat protein CotJB [Bacillota bacterium]
MQGSRERLLNQIRAIEFTTLELNLFLNSHPDNQQALRDFNNGVRQLKALKNEYERRFGPLVNFGFGYSRCPWQWINEPWPWEADSNRGCY